jgi:CarD family transcriptional regulator
MFKVNDSVVYPGHGVGRIIESVTKEIFGKKQTFLTIQIADSGMKIMVPKDNVEIIGLRRPLSKGKIIKVFKDIKGFKTVNTSTWNVRYRELMEKIKTGEFDKVCEVLKQLADIQSTQELSFGERKMIDTARSLAVAEVAVSLKISIDEATKLLSERLT